MIIINSKALGNIGESAILNKFIQLGIPTALPFGDNEAYDLIVEFCINKFFSIQCKVCHLKDGVLKCEARKRVGAKRLGSQSYHGLVDFLAIYCPELEQIYLIKLEEFQGNNYSIFLRVDNPIMHKKNIKYASDYEICKQIERWRGSVG